MSKQAKAAAAQFCGTIGIEFIEAKWKRLSETSEIFYVRIGWRRVGVSNRGQLLRSIDSY